MLDNNAVVNTINISIWDLLRTKDDIASIIHDMNKDDLKELLTKYYFLRTSEYLNTKDYKSLEKLEGILDLINQIQSLTENQ